MYSQGGCDYQKAGNRDTSNNVLIKTYPKEAGFVCMQSARPDVFDAVSAQEGGDLILDRGKDRDTLMVYLDDSLTMVKRANRGKLIGVKFGADDRVFLLRRTDMKNCAAVEEAVTTPEPGVAPRSADRATLTANKAAISVRRTNSGPGFRGKHGPRS